MTKATHSIKVRAVLLAAAASVAAGASASAAEYTWQPTTGGNHHWPTTSQDNWGTGVGGAFPGSTGAPSGDIANLTSNITANQGVHLHQPINIQVLNIGDPNGSHNFAISSGTGTQTLTLESLTPGGAAQINVSGTGNVRHVFNADLAVGGTSTLNIQVAGGQRIQTAGSFDTGTAANGNVTTITGAVAGAFWNVQGDILGSGTIVNNSASAIEFGNNVPIKSFTGRIILNSGIGGSNSGSLTLTSGSIANAAELVINGVTGYDTAVRQWGGSVWMGSGGGVSANPGQRLTQNTITLNGGLLGTVGQAVNVDAEGNDWQKGLERTRDEVATLNFNSAYSQWNGGYGSNSAGADVHVTSLQRGEGATAYLRGTVMANWSTNVRFTADNLANDLANADGSGLLKGGFGSAGTPTMSIIPWIGIHHSGGTNSPSGFATYSVDGIRPLDFDSNEYAGLITSGTSTLVNANTDNISITAATTINSLRFTGGTSNIGAGQTLTIASGAVMFTGNNASIGAAGNAEAGTLDFGSAEGVIWSNALSTNTIGAAIAGSGGLTKTGTGTLVLAGANTYIGDTHVSGGTLRVGDGTYASNLGDGDVYVHNGALLDILSGDVIADDATLILHAFGLFNGEISLAEGLTETVGGLILGDVVQGIGYYGSSDAALANPSLSIVVNDAFFGGLGVLQVVPEPSAVMLLGLALPMVMRRRRGR